MCAQRQVCTAYTTPSPALSPLYKAGHQPYLMAGAVRFDFQGYYMMAAMHVGICLLLGVLVWLFLKGTKKLRKKTAVLCVIGVKGHTKARKGGNDHETGM